MSRALPTLVLLPGLDGTGLNFAPLAAALAPSERAIAVSYPPDLPVTPDAIAAFVRDEIPSPEPHLIVAESFSGPIGLALAASPPEGCAGLVLVATFLRYPRPRLPRWLARLVAPIAFAFSPPRLAIRWLLTGRDAPASVVDTVQTSIRATHRHTLTHRLALLTHIDAGSAAAAVPVPILYLQAARDRMVPPHNLDAFLAVRPDIAVARFDCAHLVLQVQPDAALREIRAWWDRISP